VQLEPSQSYERRARKANSSKAQKQKESSILGDMARKSLLAQFSRNVGNVLKQDKNLKNWLSEQEKHFNDETGYVI